MSDHGTRKLTSALAALALTCTVVACGSSGSSSKSAGPTTTATAKNPAPYAADGPYQVGYTTLKLAHGRRVVVWYPVTKGKTAGHAQEKIDIASLLSPSLQAKVPASYRVLYPAPAYLDAPARAQTGGYPVVLFSHGFAGFPEQSVTLTSHLASWGFLVAAPDHVERSLDGLLGTAKAGIPKSTDPQVLRATLDLVESESKRSGSELYGLVDTTRVAVAGHSAGAGAAYETAAADPRIKAWISYSVGFQDDKGVGSIPAPPKKPGMVMLGTHDGIIAPAASEKVYAGMGDPKYLVKIGGAGHLVFSDLCLIGSSKGGIVSIAKVLKLPIPESLLKLASDGCQAGYPKVTTAYPAIDQLSVAFLRVSLGIDKTPQGLSTESVAALGGDVTVAHD